MIIDCNTIKDGSRGLAYVTEISGHYLGDPEGNHMHSVNVVCNQSGFRLDTLQVRVKL